jgi:hypothetical protein
MKVHHLNCWLPLAGHTRGHAGVAVATAGGAP